MAALALVRGWGQCAENLAPVIPANPDLDECTDPDLNRSAAAGNGALEAMSAISKSVEGGYQIERWNPSSGCPLRR